MANIKDAAAAFETAAAWSDGPECILNEFCRDEMIDSPFTRNLLLDRIREEIDGDGMKTESMIEESNALKQLFMFVGHAPIEKSLSKGYQ